MTPLLTLVVPAYNSEDYLERCVDSVLSSGAQDIEVIVVNDGSKDRTAEIADAYQKANPGLVFAVHKENGGHGSAINAGLRAARGVYFKVVDSDDWLDTEALEQTLALLRDLDGRGLSLDLLITNFVYEKQDKRHKRVVNYKRALPRSRAFGWDKVGTFHIWQYLLMHSMIYRTELLRECDLQVPEHSFYVDNYFAFVPLPHVRRLGYLDVDLYRYFIGRDDQSVNEKVMIGRIDQQININLMMVRSLSQAMVESELEPSLVKYMVRYAALVTAVSSTLLVREGTSESLEKHSKLWEQIREIDPDLYRQFCHLPATKLVSKRSRGARWLVRHGYDVARRIVGFN